MRTYLPRLIDDELVALLDELPALAISGPKGVGKTLTAQRLASTVLRVDDPAVRELIDADPNMIRRREAPVLLDEWQRLPSTWDVVRRWVDDGAPVGSVLMTGSAYPRGAAIHSGAGRIVELRMRPLSLAERGLTDSTVSLSRMFDGRTDIVGQSPVTLSDYAREITSSGFPGMRSSSEVARRHQLDGYLDNVVQREFAQQGLAVRAPETLRRWLRSYAAATGTTASYAKILDGATPGEAEKPAKTTTIAYRDVLQSLWLIDPIEAWAPGPPDLGRLAQTPKHFLADPALAARILDVDAGDLLSGDAGRESGLDRVAANYGGLFGRLFEALVALSLHTYAAASGARLGHMRTRNGDREVDFVLERRSSVIAFEVKLSPTVTDDDVRHLHWLRQRLGSGLTDAAVITTGTTAYRRRDGIAVVPAALLAP